MRETEQWLEEEDFGCYVEASTEAARIIVKDPARPLLPYREAAIDVEYSLHQHLAGPVVELLVSIYTDHDEAAGYAAYFDVGDPRQRDRYSLLVAQGELVIDFYDGRNRKRLTRQVPNWQQPIGRDVLRGADTLLRLVPPSRRNWEDALRAALADAAM
jgi:hypothetical protein